jgi:hypothetical protein
MDKEHLEKQNEIEHFERVSKVMNPVFQSLLPEGKTHIMIFFLSGPFITRLNKYHSYLSKLT